MKKFNPNKNIIITLIIVILVVTVLSVTIARRAAETPPMLCNQRSMTPLALSIK